MNENTSTDEDPAAMAHFKKAALQRIEQATTPIGDPIGLAEGAPKPSHPLAVAIRKKLDEKRRKIAEQRKVWIKRKTKSRAKDKAAKAARKKSR